MPSELVILLNDIQPEPGQLEPLRQGSIGHVVEMLGEFCLVRFNGNVIAVMVSEIEPDESQAIPKAA
jgi:hypothetical protein